MTSAAAFAALQSTGLALVTTSEAAAIWRMNAKAAAEALRRLAQAGLVRRIRRGLWAVGAVDPLGAVERIAEPDFAYVSLLTALRLRGLIEQIPAVVYVATTGRARRIRTPLATYSLHHIDPALFGGFERVRGVPLATAEKALVDTLYLAGSRGRLFSRLPEVELPEHFSKKTAYTWAAGIPTPRLRASVHSHLDTLFARRRPGRNIA